MLWKKTYNFQKMVNAFLHPSVIKIEDSEIFNDTLKNTLMGSENKNCNFAQSSINVTNTNKSDIDIIIPSIITPTIRSSMFVQVTTTRHECFILLHIRRWHMKQACSTIGKLRHSRQPQKHERNNYK